MKVSYSNDKADEEFKTIEETKVMAQRLREELDYSRDDEEVELREILRQNIEEVKRTGEKAL